MTDGIIQKTFNDKLNNVIMTFEYAILLKSLEQELIERIKQADFSSDTAWGITGIEIKRKLIGDNKE